MDVFISSLIGGYEQVREAAAEAITTLGHRVVRAEDFAATSSTPQQACLAAARGSDVVVLLLVDRYGAVQSSGLSATHEEYREARDSKPVLVFVQSGVRRDPDQQAFLDEVQAWASGHFRAGFSTADDLKRELIRALHEYELATSASPVDEADMVERATELLAPSPAAGGADPALVLSLAAGPHHQVIRPADLEDPGLARDLQREGMFGEHPVLEPDEATQIRIQGTRLLLEQRRAAIWIDQSGALRIAQPARAHDDRVGAVLPSLIEEEVVAALSRAMGFASSTLDRIDPLRRLTDVVPAAQLVGADYLPWRTRNEQAANPTSARMDLGSGPGRVLLTPARRHRPALTHDADHIVSDLTTLLRRSRR